MSDKCHIMPEIAGSQHPSDALNVLAMMVAFVSECVCVNKADPNQGLGMEAASGLHYVMKLIQLGIEEVSETL